jgi:hypothetical protein
MNINGKVKQPMTYDAIMIGSGIKEGPYMFKNLNLMIFANFYHQNNRIKMAGA